MGVQDEIKRIQDAKADLVAAITEKGVSVPSGSKIDALASLVLNIAGEKSENLKAGTFRVTTTTLCQWTALKENSYAIPHGLGRTPDFFFVYIQPKTTAALTSSQSLIFVAMLPETMQRNRYLCRVSDSSGGEIMSTRASAAITPIVTAPALDYGTVSTFNIAQADDEVIRFGSASACYLKTNASYGWIAGCLPAAG